MEENVQSFLVDLVQHYSDQEDISYINYDGTAEPNTVKHDPHFIMKSKDSLECTTQWLTEYLASEETIHYYLLFKELVKETSNLWVNPTLDELRAFNEKDNRDRNAFLENYISYEREWIENAKKNLLDALDKNNYSLIHEKELVDVAGISNEADYIIDREVNLKPLKVDKNLLLEYEDRKFRVSSSTLPLYFVNVVVTKRGLESQEVSKDNQMEFYFYQGISDYLEDNEYETGETAYQKLCQASVNPSLPFVEIIIDNFTEFHMNIKNLETENDILDFINEAYTVEGSDQEAKSFDRKKIIQRIFAKYVETGSIEDYLDEDNIYNNRDDNNYSFRQNNN